MHVRVNASLWRIVVDDAALDCFARDSFEKRAETSAPKNCFPFAVEHVVLRKSEREHLAQQLFLANATRQQRIRRASLHDGAV
jgi:hypothetical protein